MKTKLEMAHEYLLRFSGTTVADAWKYADAMQAEADKREQQKQNEHVFETINEWQPDWSQAPDWAKWWVVDKDGESAWCEEKPIVSDSDFWYGKEGNAPSFGYTGDWRNSLRKRPE